MSHRICLSTQIYPPEIGGVGVAAQRLAGSLSHAGYEVHVVAPRQRPGQGAPDTITTQEEGVWVHRLFHDGNGQQQAFALRALVRDLDQRLNFDLFHGFFLTAVYPCVSALDASGLARPLIASIRGNDALTLKDHPLTRAAILAGLRRATWITSVNQAYIDRVGEDIDISRRSSVIRNGVKPLPESVNLWTLSPKNRGVVGTVGQLRKVKDIPLLVRAYGLLTENIRRRLLLAGYFVDDTEEEWTWALVQELGLSSEVELSGEFPQPRVFDLMRSMHVYVQNSAFEGLPNALLEAASIGLPLVATNVGGMGEVLSNGQDALLVPHGDPQALANAIRRVLDDDRLAAQLSVGALRLTRRLSAQREAEEWLALYDGLLNQTNWTSFRGTRVDSRHRQ